MYLYFVVLPMGTFSVVDPDSVNPKIIGLLGPDPYLNFVIPLVGQQRRSWSQTQQTQCKNWSLPSLLRQCSASLWSTNKRQRPSTCTHSIKKYTNGRPLLTCILWKNTGLASVADPGCLSRIPDPTFFHPWSELSPSRIPDPHQRNWKNLSILTPKKINKMVSKL
jgi:hypothetical protein